MTPNEATTFKQIISTNSLWYQNKFIQDKLKPFFKDTKLTKKEKSIKSQVLKIFKTSKYLTGSAGYNWDQWRQFPVDTVVIHHTSSSPSISLNELSIVELIRLYVPQYLKDIDVQNTPIYSGHYLLNKKHTLENQTFASYHFLIRPSGKVIQIQDINNYLWHAGNLQINQKSVSIAFAGKFIDKEPTQKALQACSNLIKQLKINKDNVFGHNEVINKKILGETVCPGDLFLKNWKYKILKTL